MYFLTIAEGTRVGIQPYVTRYHSLFSDCSGLEYVSLHLDAWPDVPCALIRDQQVSDAIIEECKGIAVVTRKSLQQAHIDARAART